MDATRVELQVLRQQIAEACGIKRRARADDGVTRKTGELPGDIGHHIDGIAHHQVDRVRAVLLEF